MTDETKKRYLEIIGIHEKLITEAGDYARFLSRDYFVTNTIHQCIHNKILNVSRITVYRALKCKKELIAEKPFL